MTARSFHHENYHEHFFAGFLCPQPEKAQRSGLGRTNDEGHSQIRPVQPIRIDSNPENSNNCNKSTEIPPTGNRELNEVIARLMNGEGDPEAAV
jgi:hypothetical protein